MHAACMEWAAVDAVIDRNGPTAALQPQLGPCWLWLGRHDTGGYGVATGLRPGQPRQAHRLVWEFLRGRIPPGLVLDHFACENKGCVNPSHLAAVTERENILRGIAPPGINARKTHCIYGHPFEGDNLIITSRGWRHCRACTARRKEEATQMRAENREKIEKLAEDYVAELHEPALAYRPSQAARLLGVDKRTVERLIATERLQAVRVSARLTLIPRAALYDFLGVTDPLEQHAQAAR